MTTTRPPSARANARLHGVYARMAAGALPALDKIPALALDPARGSRGESPLHWFALYGRAELCLAWLGAGGAVEPDLDGRGPWHWSLAAAHNDSATALGLLGNPDLVDALASSSSWVDRFGRDPLGLLCLGGWAGRFCQFARAHPESAKMGVSLGAGGRVSCVDGWVGSVWRGNAGLEVLSREIPDLLGSLSEELPEPLRGGLWTPELWRLAVRARLTDELWARREARHIQAELPAGPETAAKAPRL